MPDHRCRIAIIAWLALMPACESSKVDTGELHDLFTRSPKAVASGSASATAGAKVATNTASVPTLGASRLRTPVAGPCVAARVEQTPRPPSRRTAKRPACRGARILEWRDPSGLPRYACVFGVRAKLRLPLVLFFHGAHDRPTAVHKKTRLRRKQRTFDMTADAYRPGFIILAMQARRYGNTAKLEFSTGRYSRSNVDVLSTDYFVDRLVSEGVVDRRQIYTVGHGSGGSMAVMYAMNRPERVAAFATVASDASHWSWSCESPPPPGFIAYRACDTIASCSAVERWVEMREATGATTETRRLGAAGKRAASCSTDAKRCKKNVGLRNHLRWPKSTEKAMLEFLSRYRMRVEP